MSTRNKVIEKKRIQYQKSTKKEKGKILDSLCLSTELSRDRLKKILSENYVKTKHTNKKSGRKRKYGPRIISALDELWPLLDYSSGKRFCAGLDDMLDAIERFDSDLFNQETKRLLRSISPATVERILKGKREKLTLKGKSTTKPGTLLKKDIPIRLGTEWDENKVGFLEIDLVAHCGSTVAGEYVNTLDVTDIFSGWTETRAIINKAQKHTFQALKTIEDKLPFTILGLDSDNGSEFINDQLYRYCKEKDIMFTRGRPFMKNDGCHIEQKNWHIVRRSIGYARYEGQPAVNIMNKYYDLLRLYSNFFLTHMKLISKTRNESKIKKKYDYPKTPYRRILEDPSIPKDQKDKLISISLSLNPIKINNDMQRLLEALYKLHISD